MRLLFSAIATVFMIGLCGCTSTPEHTLSEELDAYVNGSSARQADKTNTEFILKRSGISNNNFILNKLLKAQIPYIAVLDIWESCLNGDISKNTIVILKEGAQTSLTASSPAKYINKEKWKFITEQFSFFSNQNCFLAGNRTGSNLVILLYFDGEHTECAISGFPWFILNKVCKIPFSQRQYLLKMYFTLLAIKESTQSEVIDGLLDEYLNAQLKTSVNFIRRKFDNNTRQKNLKLLKKLYPDEIDF